MLILLNIFFSEFEFETHSFVVNCPTIYYFFYNFYKTLLKLNSQFLLFYKTRYMLMDKVRKYDMTLVHNKIHLYNLS